MKLEKFYYKKSRINQLRGFCNTVQENCSARQAALKLNIEPATVTLQIRSLEESLGIQLFERTKNHRLKLSKEGFLFYKMAILQLQSVDSLFESFHSELRKENDNSLTIAGHYTALSNILPEYIKKLLNKKEFKNLKIKLINIDKQNALTRLKKDEIDFAFYPSVQNNSFLVEIEKENIFKFKNCIFVNKNHPLANKKYITKEDISKYEYLLSDSYTFYDPRLVLDFKPSNITFENIKSDTIIGLVEENIAIGGGNEFFLRKNSNNKKVIIKNVEHLLPKMYYSLFTLKNKQHKESVSFLIDELRKDKDV